MAEKFLMPKLSPTMEEGQISRWVKNEGDSFDANETLAEVDTDKATMEMTALHGGTLLKILKGAGDTAALGEAIAITGNKGEDISALLTEIGTAKPPAAANAANGNGKSAEAPVAKAAPSVAAPAIPQSEIRIPQSFICLRSGQCSSSSRLVRRPIRAECWDCNRLC